MHPSIHVVVDDCAPDQFMSRVIDEHVDFGIGTPEKMLADADLQILMHDHLSLVCAPDHVLARKKSVRWADLAGHPVITVRPGYGIRPMIDATASGLGASIMPSAFATGSAYPDLVVKTLSGPHVSRDISVVTKRGRSLSAASQSFVDVMDATLGQRQGAFTAQQVM